MGLRVEGYDVVEALGGQEALRHFEGVPIDVAIVDLMMPGMNGLELSRVLKQRYPDTQVVLTSAYHLSRRQLELAGIGHAAFLGKPFTSDRLVQVIQTQLPSAEAAPMDAAKAS